MLINSKCVCLASFSNDMIQQKDFSSREIKNVVAPLFYSSYEFWMYGICTLSTYTDIFFLAPSNLKLLFYHYMNVYEFSKFFWNLNTLITFHNVNYLRSQNIQSYVSTFQHFSAVLHFILFYFFFLFAVKIIVLNFKIYAKKIKIIELHFFLSNSISAMEN